MKWKFLIKAHHYIGMVYKFRGQKKKRISDITNEYNKINVNLLRGINTEKLEK